MTTGGPALDAVRELERSLDVAERGGALAQQRVQGAHERAEALLADARATATAVASRTRADAHAAAEREVEAIQAAADVEIAALEERLGADGARLLSELRAIVRPGVHDRAGV